MGFAADPLVDVLFRRTDRSGSAAPAPAPEHDPSAAPVRMTGTRTRAGNAMSRTRAALLVGARRAVEVSGTRITMSQVAAASGVAKATLYNHFRTRDAVLFAVLEDEINVLVTAARSMPAPEALDMAARMISTHPLIRALARIEPAALAGLARIDPATLGWQRAGDGVRDVLAAEGRGGADLVLRWLASHLVTPGVPDRITADLRILWAGLPPVSGQRESA